MVMVAVVAVCRVGWAQEASPAAPADLVPQEEDPNTGFSFAATLDLYSAYVWRGFVQNDRPVWQPGGTVSYKMAEYGTLSANVWANFDMTDHAGHRSAGNIYEVDYTTTYAVDVGPLSLSAGHIFYTWPKAGGQDYFNSTREVFGTVAYNNDVVTPFLRVYYDYLCAEGFYGLGGLTKTVSLTDRLSAGAEVSLGACDGDYMNWYTGVDEAGFVDFNAALFTSYALTENLSVGARLAWVSLVDGDARDQEAYYDEDLLWGGVNLSASF